MNTGQTIAGPMPTAQPRRRGLEISLWLLIGALIGALVISVVHSQREAARRANAKASLIGLVRTSVPRVAQQLNRLLESSGALETELLTANALSTSKDIKLARYRAQLKRIKDQFERADEDLRRLSEQMARVSANIDAAQLSRVLAPDQQQNLETVEQQLEQARQQLGSLDGQMDWVVAHWSQLVTSETEAAKQAEVRQARHEAVEDFKRSQAEAALPVNSETSTLTSLLLLNALRAEEARVDEKSQPVAFNPLGYVQPPAPPWPGSPTVVCVPRRPFVGYDRSYYPYQDSLYRAGSSYGCRLSGFYTYGCGYPMTRRFGAYLVVN